MRRVEGDRVVERAAPVIERLAGAAVDEVEVERLEARRSGVGHGSLDVGTVVRATQRLRARGRRSTARRATGGSRRPPGRCRPARAVTSSGLHSTVTSAVAVRGMRSRSGDQLGRRHHRGRAAADEDRRRLGHAGRHQAVRIGAAGLEVGVGEVVAVGPRRERAVVATRRRRTARAGRRRRARVRSPPHGAW